MIPDELDTLRTAAERDDRLAVMRSIERLDVAFERDRIESQRFDTMAVLLDQRIDDVHDDVAKNEYREAVIELEQRRIELDRSVLAYVRAKGSSATLIASVDAADEARHAYQASTEELITTISDVPVPPLIVLWGRSVLEVPKGGTAHAEATLSTVSRSHPDSITIDVESAIPASGSPSLIKGLDEGETVTVRIELSPSAAGEFGAVVTATGEANVDRLRLTVLVLAKREYVLRASRLTSSLETVLASLGRQNGLRNQARTLRRRLDVISNDVEKQRQPTHSIDNRLSAARNNVESIKRQVSTSNRSVQRQEAIYLIEDISGAIDSAIEALS